MAVQPRGNPSKGPVAPCFPLEHPQEAVLSHAQRVGMAEPSRGSKAASVGVGGDGAELRARAARPAASEGNVSDTPPCSVLTGTGGAPPALAAAMP